MDAQFSSGIPIIIRQVGSRSGVLGKQLVNKPTGHNLFVFISRYPTGGEEGFVYSVEVDPQDPDKMLRKLVGITFDEKKLLFAPAYKAEQLGQEFWEERF
jgi:hypothetical protein